MNPSNQRDFQNRKTPTSNQQLSGGSFRIFRNTPQNNPKESNDPKISEKEFYDQLKIQIESQSDVFLHYFLLLKL